MPRRFFASRPREGWLVGLDGLRALAVSAVVLYHFRPAEVSGGFLGVDLFFVLSGFVITTLALREITEHQRIDIGAFYRRRIRRLVPAVAFLILVVTVGSLSYWPDARATLLPSAAAGLFFSANWWLVAGEQSYFVQSGRPPLLQHLWSLAVEEQFYLLWPLIAGLLVGGGAWLWRRPVVLRPRTLRRFALAAFVMGCASSAAMAALAIRDDVPYGQDSSRIYFGTDTHSMGLFFGAAVAALSFVRVLPGRRRHRLLRGAFLSDLVALAGLGILVRAVVHADEFSPALYQTGFVSYSLVAAAVVACVVRPRSLVGWLLDRPILTWLGRRSYSIYLWHWPVAVVTRPDVDVTWSPGVLLALRLAVTISLAEVSYRCVEQPIRSGQLQAWYARHLPVQRRRRLVRTLLPATGLATLLLATSLGSAWAYSADNSAAGATSAALPTQWVSPTPGSAAALSLMTPAGGGLPAGFAKDPFTLGTASPSEGQSTAAHSAATKASSPTATGAQSLPAASPAAQAPTPVVAPLPGAISAFGDSVMLGAAPAMRAVMPNVDVHAVEGRQARAVFNDVATVRASGQLAPVVVIHAGDNGIISPADLAATLASLADRARVVVLTDRVAKAWQDPNNKTLARLCAQYPNVVLADWFALSNGQPGWFYKDGLHLRLPGAQQYAALIVGALGR